MKLAFYYVVEAKDENNVNPSDYVREELDKGKIQHLVFKWFTIEELKQIDFRPKFVVECLDSKDICIKTTRD